jgi:hypothetical protein
MKVVVGSAVTTMYIYVCVYVRGIEREGIKERKVVKEAYESKTKIH